MKHFVYALLACTALSACASVPTAPAPGLTQQQTNVLQQARAGCSTWEIVDISFQVFAKANVVKIPPDVPKWENALNTTVRAACAKIQTENVDLTTLSGLIPVISNAVLAVADYMGSQGKAPGA